MIITKKHLEEIEAAVGHSCTAGVLAGINQGTVCVRVWTDMYGSQLNLSNEEYINDRWEFLIDDFKRDAAMQFDHFYKCDKCEQCGRDSHGRKKCQWCRDEEQL